MTTAETVRRLLLDAAGEALCDACLAFACSVSLAEMREATNELIKTLGFEFRNRCASCRRTVPAIAYLAKCAHCSRVVLPGEKAFETNGDILHAACFTRAMFGRDHPHLAEIEPGVTTSHRGVAAQVSRPAQTTGRGLKLRSWQRQVPANVGAT